MLQGMLFTLWREHGIRGRTGSDQDKEPVGVHVRKNPDASWARIEPSVTI